MTEGGREWFAPKRYGYGAGLPISWQGWLALFTYAMIVTAAVTLLVHRPLALISVVLAATVKFLVICARTTRGGWRWRWGDDD